jgi:hypothetical protein
LRRDGSTTITTTIIATEVSGVGGGKIAARPTPIPPNQFQNN